MFTSLLVGALGAGMQGLNSIKDNVLNNYYARKNASKEFRRTVDLWNLENEYNKPVNQMARLKEAGLNPNMVYGGGATTLAASTHGAPRSNESWQGVKAGFMDTINAYQDMRQKDAMTENLKAQNELIRSQGREAEARADIAAHNASLLRGTDYIQGESFLGKLNRKLSGKVAFVKKKGEGDPAKDVIVRDPKKPAIGNNVLSVPDDWFPRFW